MGQRTILMNKIILLLLVAGTITLYGSAQQVTINESGISIIPSAGSLPGIAKDYFSFSPYEGEFSKFLNYLLNSSRLTNKQINKRTDSNFFFFKAEYNNYSPFSFKTDRTEIRLAEREIR